MNNLRRREFLENMLSGVAQAAGAVVIGTTLPAKAAANATVAEPLQMRADRLAANLAADAASRGAAWVNGFANGGFRNAGFANGGFRNAGFRNAGFANGGFRNGGFVNGGWRN